MSSTEIFDPAFGTWSDGPSLFEARYAHTANLLPSGEVLVSGGFASSGAALDSVEILSAQQVAWRRIGPLNTARGYHAAVLLADGRVLVVGGAPMKDYPDSASLFPSAEWLDVLRSSWTRAEPLSFARTKFAAVLLHDGRVLVTGGTVNGPQGETEVFE
jgi:hypothetical protein